MEDDGALLRKPLKLECYWEPGVGGWMLALDADTLGDNIGLRKGSPPREVTITLNTAGAPKPNITFDQRAPIFASETSCQDAQQGKSVKTDQLQLQAVDPNGRFITFENRNSGPPRTIHYQLNFSDGTSYDPVFRNGGGR